MFPLIPFFPGDRSFPVFPEPSIKMVLAWGIGVALIFFSLEDIKSGEVLKQFIRRKMNIKIPHKISDCTLKF